MQSRSEGSSAFVPEGGTHAGPSATEMHTFIVHPTGVSLPLPITHPTQLYEHFIGYRSE